MDSKLNNFLRSIIGLKQKFAETKEPQRIIRTKTLSVQDVKVSNPQHLWGLYTNEFSDLNPMYLHRIFEDARKGLNFEKSLLFEDIRRKDLHIGGVCQTRKLAVAKKTWDLRYGENSPVSESEQTDTINFIKNNFARVRIAELIANCVEAQIQGVSTFEINYDIFDSRIGLKKISYIPNHLLLFDDLNDQYRYLDLSKIDLLRIRTESAMGTMKDRIDVVPLSVPIISPYKILEVHSLDGNAQNGFMNGCIDALLWAYFFKNYGMKDFAIYLERLGIPPIIVKRPELMNDNELTELWGAIKNWGHLLKLLIPDTVSVELMQDQNKQSSGNLFKDYKQIWDDGISIRVLGQTLTSDIGSEGSYAAAKVHDLVRNDIVASDMILAADAINELIRRLILLNNPGVKDFPIFHFKEEIDINFQKARSEVFTNIRSSGYVVKKETLEKEFGVLVDEAPTSISSPLFADTPLSFKEKMFSDKTVKEKTISEYLNNFFKNSKQKT